MPITEARLSDAVEIAALHAQSWREHYRGEFEDAYLDGNLVAERTEVWRARLTRPAPNQCVFVARSEAGLEGFVCVYGDHDPAWGSLVDNLHVVTTRHRRGTGRALMRAAGEWLARRFPDPPVHLLVLESNARARGFYEAIGGRCAQTSAMETNGGALVRSCHYVWDRAEALRDAAAA